MRAKLITSYLAAATFFFILAICAVVFPDKNSDPSFHKEIIPSNAIGYIKDDKLIELKNGKYLLAMPEGGTFVKGVAPMLLVKVGKDYYPLNIADDSILPRQGKMLPLKILFGFTSPHASNTLKYEEKTGEDPRMSYLRKARYYLHVENGYGTVKRSYYYQ
jgi:hypothetical protein